MEMWVCGMWKDFMHLFEDAGNKRVIKKVMNEMLEIEFIS
jgi:hypothetical protein